MFGIGTTEVLIILVVALLVIGPSKLPEVAKALGKGMAEFKKMSSDVKRTIDMETHLAEMEQEEKEQKPRREDQDPEQATQPGGPVSAETGFPESRGLEEETETVWDQEADVLATTHQEGPDEDLDREDASARESGSSREDTDEESRATQKSSQDPEEKRNA
ncbi:MAG: Sec-independent protein translocase protein TatB [Desulfohalobiaceae bacterium]|nr:Sec-independent protein translocase protein TatB [Desulfohalobiaceae bacterium]